GRARELRASPDQPARSVLLRGMRGWLQEEPGAVPRPDQRGCKGGRVELADINQSTKTPGNPAGGLRARAKLPVPRYTPRFQNGRQTMANRGDYDLAGDEPPAPKRRVPAGARGAAPMRGAGGA